MKRKTRILLLKIIALIVMFLMIFSAFIVLFY